MTLLEYLKRNKLEQSAILREHAIYLDQYTDKDKTVFVYYLDGFFIEAVTKVGVIIDTIPYRRYNIDRKQLDSALKKYAAPSHMAA